MTEEQFLHLMEPSAEPMTLLGYASGVAWADAEEQNPVDLPISHLWDRPWQWEGETGWIWVDRRDRPYRFHAAVIARGDATETASFDALTMPEVIAWLNAHSDKDFATVQGRVQQG